MVLGTALGAISRSEIHATMKLPSPPPNLLSPAVHAAAAFALSAAIATAPPVFADARTVGEIQGSGLVFKDTLKVEAFADPKVSGVTLYISDFQRPVTEKLAKGDIFSDPSQGGFSCNHRPGKVIVSKEASRDKGGEEVFSEQRSLVFKSLKVRRLVDVEGGNVIYAEYSQRLDKGEDSNNSRFNSNLCTVMVDGFEE